MAHVNAVVLASYIETALWSTNDESTESGGYPLDQNYSAEDLAPECAEEFEEDVTNFIELLKTEGVDTSGISDEMLGYDFWLDRNGHGAGFWDRGLGDLGDRLSKLCEPFGEVYLYVGDDGQLHC